VVYLLIGSVCRNDSRCPALSNSTGHFPDSALISEPFDEPGVGAAACFPNGKMASSEREWPSRDLFRFLKDCSGFACKSHIQSVGTPAGDEATTQRLRPSSAQSRHAIPVQDCNVRIRSFPLATEKPNVSEPRGEVLLAKASVEPSGEKRPICKYHSESQSG